MHILITGGTGLIGQRLMARLLTDTHHLTILSRQAKRPDDLPNSVNFVQWDSATAAGWGHIMEEVDVVINLAGAGIADERWTAARKKVLRDSRINAGQAVVEAIQAARQKPKALLQSSAVGYYGTSENITMTEESPVGGDFLAKICLDWEVTVKPVEALGVRTVYLRTGVVLDPQGGALPKMALPFKLMAGGPIGSGRQWMSWIHQADEVAAIQFLMENDNLSGAFNLTAPQPLRNKDFAKVMGKAMRRPALAPTPGLALKLLFGEMATVLLEGQKVLPTRLQEAGFNFQYPDLESALTDLL